MSQADDRLLQLALDFVPVLKDRAVEVEGNGKLPTDLAKDLATGGFYNICSPMEHGGQAASPLTYAKAVEILATGDASAAWCSFIASSTAFAFACGGDQTIQSILASDRVILAGAFAPQGVATLQVRDGVSGYLVSGEWDWGSGSQNADWIGAGCVIDDRSQTVLGAEMKTSEIKHVLFAKEQVLFHDTWHVMGLQGTGSTRFSVREAFVPLDRVVTIKDSRHRKDVIFNFPMFSMLSIGIGAVALGIAEAALNETKTVVTAQQSSSLTKSLAERSSIRIAIAEAHVSLLAARTLFHQEIVAAWRAAIDDRVELGHRVALRLAINHAVKIAKQVTVSMFETAGSTAIYSDSTFQRRLRDIQVAAKHIMVSEITYDVAARHLLKLPVDTSTF